MKLTMKTRLQALQAQKLLNDLMNSKIIYGEVDYTLVVKIDEIIDCLEHIKSEVVVNYGKK